jgi:hypothetical protein
MLSSGTVFKAVPFYVSWEKCKPVFIQDGRAFFEIPPFPCELVVKLFILLHACGYNVFMRCEKSIERRKKECQ